LDALDKKVGSIIRLIIGASEKMAVGSLLIGLFQDNKDAAFTALLFFIVALGLTLTTPSD
jgi:hypothetical protein